MEIPSRLASRFRNALCGSVNEIICLVIAFDRYFSRYPWSRIEGDRQNVIYHGVELPSDKRTTVGNDSHQHAALLFGEAPQSSQPSSSGEYLEAISQAHGNEPLIPYRDCLHDKLVSPHPFRLHKKIKIQVPVAHLPMIPQGIQAW